MRFLLSLLVASMLLYSCGNNHAPDVSDIKIELTTQRFDKDFFALDSNNIAKELEPLLKKYPAFAAIFINRVMGADPNWSTDTLSLYLKSFISHYRPLYDSVQKTFPNFSGYEAAIKKGLQYAKYYFPGYVAPTKIVTYIGPLDGDGDILYPNLFTVGLHQHLGRNFSMYSTEWVRQTYPDYITARFEPAYIAINCMKNIVSDIYPEKLEDKSLVVQMVEKGKGLYLLQKLLPDTKENKLIGYTEKQWKESKEHEAAIWDLFVQNNFLQSIDYNIIKNYIGEAPKTQELGEASPGNIGSFCGWQIVNKYMDKFPSTALPELLAMDAENIFKEAKYKP